MRALLYGVSCRGLGAERLLERLRSAGIQLYDVRRGDAKTLSFYYESGDHERINELLKSLGFACAPLPVRGYARCLTQWPRLLPAVLALLTALCCLAFSLQFFWRIDISGAGAYAGEVRQYLHAQGLLTRPAVEAGEKLGFLPGDMTQKVDPYLRPLYDALHELMGADSYLRLAERGTVEVAPLAFMRGRTLSDAFIILDEAQNATSEQMKMFLTRLGANSRCIVTGDVSQTDLPKDKKSGLVEAVNVLRNVEGVAIVELTARDVVRHELVQRIVQAYEKYEKNGGKA